MSLTTRASSPAERRTTTAPGTFHLLGDDALVWSEPVFRLHGFEPGDVVPSTSLMLAHCHRDDRPALEAVLRAAPTTPGEGRSVRYRLLDATGTERVVLAVLAPGLDQGHAHGPRTAAGGAQPGAAQPGRAASPAEHRAGPDAPTAAEQDHAQAGRPSPAAEHRPAGEGRSLQLLGLLVDLGAEIGATAARRADEMLTAAIASREVIDQAKGAAMLAYGLDGPAAFELLRWHSEHLNVKVRTVAERMLGALPGRRRDSDPRDVLDDALASLVGAEAPVAGAAPTVDAPSALGVRHRVDGRSVLVALDGEADAATAPALVAGFADALRAVPPRGMLVVDASHLRRLGPVAALHLARLRRRCDNAGVALRILPPAGGRPEMR